MYKRSLICVALLATCFMVGCGKGSDSQTAEVPTVPVRAAQPEVKDVTVYIDAIGTLLPLVRMDVRPQADGTLSKVLVREGDRVEAGTPLFHIDPTIYENKVRQAEAQLAIDEASWQAAQKKWKRFKDLAEKDLIAQTEWDEIEALVAKAEAVVALDAARLEAAKLDLEDCIVRSPIRGRVGKIDAHPGLIVSDRQPIPLTTVSNVETLIVEFAVTEKEFAKIPHDLATVEMRSLCASGSCQPGEVTFVDHQFDPRTGLLLIRGHVPNPDRRIRPGQAVKVSVPVSVIAKALLIPERAVRYNQQGPYVYVVQADQTIALRQLILGAEHDDHVIVSEGLDPSEPVVVEGHLRIAPGTKVEIKS